VTLLMVLAFATRALHSQDAFFGLLSVLGQLVTAILPQPEPACTDRAERHHCDLTAEALQARAKVVDERQRQATATGRIEIGIGDGYIEGRFIPGRSAEVEADGLLNGVAPAGSRAARYAAGHVRACPDRDLSRASQTSRPNVARERPRRWSSASDNRASCS